MDSSSAFLYLLPLSAVTLDPSEEGPSVGDFANFL